MIRLIGLRWKHGNVCSREVLIVRGLALCVVFVLLQSMVGNNLTASIDHPARAEQFMRDRRIGHLLR
jgi:preprotein translocase subunit SecG